MLTVARTERDSPFSSVTRQCYVTLSRVKMSCKKCGLLKKTSLRGPRERDKKKGIAFPAAFRIDLLVSFGFIWCHTLTHFGCIDAWLNFNSTNHYSKPFYQKRENLTKHLLLQKVKWSCQLGILYRLIDPFKKTAGAIKRMISWHNHFRRHFRIFSLLDKIKDF